ncbi:response regulator transcription factor [bacterium]|jgi:DNA-binding response OmpR family regulator|nr:response regulator transcription factor [Verrucomicrobiota bacterium]MDA7645488.1 response regulator transcription factor [bacterium]MDA7680514.1 response regulator transcription factor [bacterium]
MRVLIVEDSGKLREAVKTALRRSGFSVDATGDGEEGLWLAENNPYDALILDIMLPGIDGLTILERLRKRDNPSPVLLLTARDTIDDRVSGLNAGADDYVVKPFALKELIARVKALCRRGYGQHTRLLQVDDLTLDAGSKLVGRSGNVISLTAREFAILEYLLLNKGRVVSRSDIEAHIYDDLVSPVSNVVDSAVCTLRKKLEYKTGAKPLIHTRRGQGFIVCEPE